jgi:hypothetical protein
VGVSAGHIHSDSFTTGPAMQVEAQADLWVTRAFGLGLRYRFLRAQTDGDRETLTLHPLSAGLRIRLWTDETERESWTLEPEGGYALAAGGRAEGGAFAGLTVARNVGWVASDTGSFNSALALSVLQGFGAMGDVRVVSLGVRVGPALNAFAPTDADVPRRPAAFHYTFGVQWAVLGARWGLVDAVAVSPNVGVVFGVPLTRWLEPVVRADLSYFAPIKRDEPSPVSFAFLGGVRFRLNGLAPLYASALAGWQVVGGRSPLAYGDGAVLDLGVGFNPTICGTSLQIGVHYRTGLSHQATDFNALMLVLGFTYGSRGGSVGDAPLDSGRPHRCTPARSPHVPYGTAGQSPAPVQAQVAVVADPVEVVVPIGASLFGGMVRFQLNLAALPIERLLRAGWVTVRVEGPPEALPQASAELRAALDARGVTVQGYATAAVPDASEVRAVFSVWPPGTRPR